MSRLFNYENIKEEDLKNINFSKAYFAFVNDSDINKSINLSGVKIIEKLVSIFFSNKKANFSFYVDFSTIASTIETNNLLDYILINNLGGYLDIDRIKKNYYYLYNNLKNNNKGIFYHPNFFLRPQSDKFYIDHKVLGNVIKDINNDAPCEKSDPLPLIESGSNLYYTVTKLGIDFIHFTKNSNEIKYVEGLDKLNQHLLEKFNQEFTAANENESVLYSYLLSIPIIGFNSSFEQNSSFEGQGSIFLYAITDKEIEITQFNELANKISNLTKDITYNYLLSVGLKLAEKSRKNAIKSSVAAIMSRNMSHNLGSHVLSNLKGELENIANDFKANHDSKVLGFKSENLYGLKWFINYLQERQDFIATIGGFENQTFMPVSFKSFVFDGLLPDHQFSRHHKRDDKEEENKETVLNAHKNYLLEYIIKSENVKRDQIVVKYKNFISSKPHSVRDDNDYKKLGQIIVSFPGGIVGRQAFFSIFENILRNAAKHNTINGDLALTIDTPEDEDYDKSEFIKFTITDNLKSYPRAYQKLNVAINEPIFNESQEKQGNKGIKEMKISAAWLRGISLEDIDNHREIKENGIIQIPKLLEVVESYNSLQYVFYLLKPKELLLFLTCDEKDKLVEWLDIELLERNGINIITPEYFNHKKNYNLRHSLFVIQSDLKDSDKENIEKYFNQRKLFLEVDKLRRIFEGFKSPGSKSKPEILISTFWKEYLGFKEGNTLPKVHIRPKEMNKDEEIFSDGFNVKLISEETFQDQEMEYVFKHHNDTESYFKDFRKDNKTFFNGLNFLEGISGGNSTDLLLCRTEKTELFYYKLYQSCTTDIIIVDERLWNNNSKTDIEQFSKMLDGNTVRFNQYLLDEINKIQDNQKWAKEILQTLKIEENEHLCKELVSVHEDRFDKEFLDYITKDVLKVEILNEGLADCKEKNDYKYWLYKKKNIEVANIFFNKDGFGLCNLSLDIVGEYSKNSNLSFKLLLNKHQHKIISFHQGIIDKIQNMLNDQDKINTQNAIDILNKAIPKDFIKIIHSGRGKPSVKIPEGFYYVPYASLESAFYDCKFSLADLLFNSKAELV